MKPSHGIDGSRQRVVILHEVDIDTGFNEILLAIGFREKTTVIAKLASLDKLDAFYAKILNLDRSTCYETKTLRSPVTCNQIAGLKIRPTLMDGEDS
jgi:hypothetical protein